MTHTNNYLLTKPKVNIMKLKPGLGGFYAIQLGNGSGSTHTGLSTPSPGWDPRGQGPSKNRQGPCKNNWTVRVKKSKRLNGNPV